MKRRLSAAIALALAPVAGIADAQPRSTETGPLWVNGGYQYQVEKASDLQGDGYGLGAWLDVTDYVSFGVSYADVETEEFERFDGALGRLEFRTVASVLGGYLPVTDAVGVSASAGYAYGWTSGLDGFAEDPEARNHGVIGNFGLHARLLRWVDLSAGRGYSFFGGDREWDTSAGLSLHALSRLWIDTGYWVTEDMEGWSAGLRARLGN